MASRFVLPLALIPACSAVLPGRSQSVLTDDTDCEREREVGLLHLPSRPSSFISLAVEEQVKHEPLLCGDTQIRTILRVSDVFDIERVKNIRFGDAYNKANQYLEKRRVTEAELIARLGQLEEHWYQRSSEANAGREVIEDAQLRQVISALVTSSYSSVEVASKSDCSILPEDCPGSRDAYKATEDGFEAAFAPLLRSGAAMVSGAASVKKVCLEVLNAGLGAGACLQLCESLAAKAVALSDRPLSTYQPGTATAGQLAGDIEDVKKQLDALRSDIKDCEATRAGVQEYEKKLKEIGSRHDMNSKLSRDVQGRMRAVTDCLQKARACSERQQTLLAEFSKVIAKTHEQQHEVEASLEANVRLQASLKGQIKHVEAGLNGLQDVLKDSQKAVNAMQAFKARAAVAMQSFVQIYNDAVRAPLRTLGLTQVVDRLRDDLWPKVKGEGQQRRWELSERYTRELKAECTGVATSSSRFCTAAAAGGGDEELSSAAQQAELCKAGHSLEQICTTDDASAYVANIRDTVDERQRELREWLQRLRVELDELANSGVDATGEQGNIAKGEPEFLRRFTSALSSTNFYRDFVQDWAVAGGDAGARAGRLQEMTAVIAGILEQLAGKVRAATEHFRALNAQWVQSVSEDTALHTKLTGLSKVLIAESNTQIKAESKIAEFKREIQSKEQEQQRFQAQLAALTASLEELRRSLEAEFGHFQASANHAFKEEVAVSGSGDTESLSQSAAGRKLRLTGAV